MQILLVEDDAVIASGLVYALEQEGYSVCHAETVAACFPGAPWIWRSSTCSCQTQTALQ